MKMNEESVFSEALAKGNPRERASFLDQACAGDPALRDSVDSLLAAYEAGSFLETPATERPGNERKDPAPESNTQAEPPIDTNESVSLEFLTPSAKPDALGRLGHYDVLEVIGKGGMGIVLRAFDEQLHRMVAIKVMAAQLATNASARIRFKREAQAQAAVSHDHIVTIHAVEEAGPLPYLVMQYVAGLSLQERLDKDGPLELQEILRIGMQTASGLAAAHAQGLVHRDIKPANILLENGVERVKVADFGLARAATEANLTQSGVVAGTPQYMSPEQAEGTAIDQRTDLFSLGSVMYAMCTGRAPFRASGSMAVLKRVCEETPTPIRESNPEIPDRLVAIIEKLHAKDPAQRYQSAAEVAELLKEHLAHVQHPSVVGHVSNVPVAPEARWKRAPRRRLALAAAVLLCFIGGLSLTEATGVTNLRATVIRIFTPDGTLVVEVDDPDVKVTVEGDGGLVITGAGPHEVRLRPGSYRLRADKDGKPVPLERELVSIARGHKQVVRVSLEGRARPLARDEIRRFEGHTHPVNSVAFSSDGRYAVTASGNCAHLQPDPPGARDDSVRLWEVKTGKEVHRFAGHWREVCGVAISRNGDRILSAANDNTVRLWDANTGQELRQYKGHRAGVATVAFSPDGRYAASAGGGNDGKGLVVDCDVHLWEVETGKEVRRFKGHTHQINSLAFSPDGRHLLTGSLSLDNSMRLWDVETGKEVRRFSGHTHWVTRVAFSRDGRHALSASWDKTARLWEVETGKELKRFEVPHLVDSVAFSPDSRQALAGTHKGVMYLWDLQTGKELRRYEGRYVAISPDGRQAVSGSADGTVRLWDLPEQVAETQAFVLLGPTGAFERKFATLAEAVQGASDGDTIEVRGNGPFVTDPISNPRLTLTISAGRNFRPVIKLSPEGVRSGRPLITTNAALVLEGLELHRARPEKPGDVVPVVRIFQAPFRAANCRFFGAHVFAHGPSISVFCNCEFLGDLGAFGGEYRPGTRVTLDNCLFWSTWAGALGLYHGDVAFRDNSIQIKRGTFVCRDQSFYLPLPAEAAQPIRLEVSDSIFAGSSVLGLNQTKVFLDKVATLEPVEAEAAVLRLLQWRGERNAFATGSTRVRWCAEGKPQPPHGPKRLEEWNRFWGDKEPSSLEGQIRFQGGDLLAKLVASPEQLTPEDFRLRPDSAGYKAGKDSKDLGADVDLVGPGPAYERWKKSPAYQEWLKDTKQTRAETLSLRPFVVIANEDKAEQKFATLAEAVAAAGGGDTVEVHGNGPFLTGQLNLPQESLCVRAGPGFQPVICTTEGTMLLARGRLFLEGLELIAGTRDFNKAGYLVNVTGPELRAAHCRFVVEHFGHCVAAWPARQFELRSCELHQGRDNNSATLEWWFPREARGRLENCIISATALAFGLRDSRIKTVEIGLARNTILTRSLSASAHDDLLPAVPAKAPAWIFNVEGNILQTSHRLLGFSYPDQSRTKIPSKEVLKATLGWKSRKNLLMAEGGFLGMGTGPLPLSRTLPEWQAFWDHRDTGDLEGAAQFQGGNPWRKTPGERRPKDFRLAPGSPGQGAGPNGTDLGADVDLVGPGPAYERWQKTPDYQQWLKDTGQKK